MPMEVSPLVYEYRVSCLGLPQVNEIVDAMDVVLHFSPHCNWKFRLPNVSTSVCSPVMVWLILELGRHFNRISLENCEVGSDTWQDRVVIEYPVREALIFNLPVDMHLYSPNYVALCEEQEICIAPLQPCYCILK